MLPKPHTLYKPIAFHNCQTPHLKVSPQCVQECLEPRKHWEGSLGATVPVPSQSGLRQSALPMSTWMSSVSLRAQEGLAKQGPGDLYPFFSFSIRLGCEGAVLVLQQLLYCGWV